MLDRLEDDLVVDHSLEAFISLGGDEEEEEARMEVVELVLDNCGLELVADFALADFLVTKMGAKKVRRPFPWRTSFHKIECPLSTGPDEGQATRLVRVRRNHRGHEAHATDAGGEATGR